MYHCFISSSCRRTWPGTVVWWTQHGGLSQLSRPASTAYVYASSRANRAFWCLKNNSLCHICINYYRVTIVFVALIHSLQMIEVWGLEWHCPDINYVYTLYNSYMDIDMTIVSCILVYDLLSTSLIWLFIDKLIVSPKFILHIIVTLRKLGTSWHNIVITSLTNID